MLILLLNKTDNAKWILPQKFFEYLTAGVPILAIGPSRSDLADIMTGQGLGCFTDGQNKSEIETFVLSNFNGEFKFNHESAGQLLKKFSRENQAKRLANLIEEI